jgi:hypothetical protein
MSDGHVSSLLAAAAAAAAAGTFLRIAESGLILKSLV